jgi:hypothetical protein
MKSKTWLYFADSSSAQPEIVFVRSFKKLFLQVQIFHSNIPYRYDPDP